MSVITVKTALAAELAGVTGLSTAQVKANAPEQLGDLPALVIFTGPAVPDVSMAGLATERREYRLRLYVVARGQGIEGEAEAAANTWFPALRNYLLARPTLPAAAGVLSMEYLGDGGLIVAPFAGQDYYAIEFRVAVIEAIPYAYAANH